MAPILDQRDRTEIEGAAHLPCLRDGRLRRLLRRGGLVQLLQRPEESRLLLLLPPDRAEQPLRLDRAGDFARERLEDALLLRRESRRPIRNQRSHQSAATLLERDAAEGRDRRPLLVVRDLRRAVVEPHRALRAENGTDRAFAR